MKKCSSCGELKPLNEFNKKSRNKDGLQDRCRDCNKKRSKKYYADNKEAHLLTIKSRKKKNQKELKKRILEIKLNTSCPFCGENDPVCLDFHHLHGKDLPVSQAVRKNWGWNRILKEINKCILICSNCHRKVHAGKLEVTEEMLRPKE